MVISLACATAIGAIASVLCIGGFATASLGFFGLATGLILGLFS